MSVKSIQIEIKRATSCLFCHRAALRVFAILHLTATVNSGGQTVNLRRSVRGRSPVRGGAGFEARGEVLVC